MRKWKNRGHEFDDLGKIFQKNNEILIIGSKDKCCSFEHKLKFLDRNIHQLYIEEESCSNQVIEKILFQKLKLEKDSFFSKVYNRIYRIHPFRILLKKSHALFDNKLVLVAGENLNTSASIMETLIAEYGRRKNQDIFLIDDFFAKYLSIFAAYVSNKVYFTSNSFLCTTICNLNCKNCLNFAPYDVKKEHYDIQNLRKSVDLYFKCVDRVGLFHISGGEPLLYPKLKELIEYIGKNYKDKIEILSLSTNGTKVPDDNVCETIKKYGVKIFVDDYREAVPHIAPKFEKLINKIKSYDINFEIPVAGKAWNWISLFPPRKDMRDATEKELIEKFHNCDNIFTELKSDRLYLCNYSGYAYQAGLVTHDDNDYYCLKNYTKENLKELVEFRMGFSVKGYAEFCKYCNGFPSINPSRVSPAEQAKGILKWDINNPTKNQEK